MRLHLGQAFVGDKGHVRAAHCVGVALGVDADLVGENTPKFMFVNGNYSAYVQQMQIRRYLTGFTRFTG